MSSGSAAPGPGEPRGPALLPSPGLCRQLLCSGLPASGQDPEPPPRLDFQGLAGARAAFTTSFSAASGWAENGSGKALQETSNASLTKRTAETRHRKTRGILALAAPVRSPPGLPGQLEEATPQGAGWAHGGGTCCTALSSSKELRFSANGMFRNKKMNKQKKRLPTWDVFLCLPESSHRPEPRGQWGSGLPAVWGPPSTCITVRPASVSASQLE